MIDGWDSGAGALMRGQFYNNGAHNHPSSDELEAAAARWSPIPSSAANPAPMMSRSTSCTAASAIPICTASEANGPASPFPAYRATRSSAA
jgi:hypothetical protein